MLETAPRCLCFSLQISFLTIKATGKVTIGGAYVLAATLNKYLEDNNYKPVLVPAIHATLRRFRNT